MGPDRQMKLFQKEKQIMEGKRKSRLIRSQIAKLEVVKVELSQNLKGIKQIPQLESELTDRFSLVKNLTTEADGLREDIKDIQDDWLTYRKKRRKIVRRKFQGQFFPEFRQLNGRIFNDVRIRKVEPSGVSISHRGGIARIPVKQLNMDLRLDLDLTLDEAEVALNKERAEEKARRQLIEKTVAFQRKADAVTNDPELNPELASQQLRTAKRKVEQMVRQMYSAQAEASRARSNDAFNPKRSVPGSLESWKDRARRMDRAANSLRSKIDRAIRKVRKLDPNYRPPRLD